MLFYAFIVSSIILENEHLAQGIYILTIGFMISFKS